MKPPFQQSRLQQKQQTEETHQQIQKQEDIKEFDSVEELLRYDAEQTTPPPAIAERLKDSLTREPVKPRPWWRRFFS